MAQRLVKYIIPIRLTTFTIRKSTVYDYRISSQDLDWTESRDTQFMPILENNYVISSFCE